MVLLMDPIETKLKNKNQVAIARAQDLAMEALLALDEKLILHGGTAIWRCYNGKRFSYDLDIYASSIQVKKISNELKYELSKRGLYMDIPTNSEKIIDIHSNDAVVKLEINVKTSIKNVQMVYSKADGSSMFINTLNASDFIIEKIKAYNSRLYIRDLYDIYHLVSTQAINENSIKSLIQFLGNIEKPVDTKELQDLVYEGIAPSFEVMLGYIKTKIEKRKPIKV
jgi:predicted nucleotidyltransferase component of viral defense system